MHERMLNKQTIPTEDEIKKHIGKNSVEIIDVIKSSLEKSAEIKMELKFPFGNNYGWGYKISNKSKHLFYLFFEKGSITLMLQIGRINTKADLERYGQLSEEGKKYWENRYPCGEGGWIHYRITNRKQLKDIALFLGIKAKKEIIL